MKKLKIILFIIGILIAACSFAETGRGRDQKTSSWRAYYGVKPQPQKFKKKKQKVDWAKHNEPAKGTRADVRSTRKKFRHV
jgi:hypothetical protein